MTKSALPSDSKASVKILYPPSVHEDTSGDNDKSRQQSELLAFFDALSESQHSAVLSNLRADKEEGEFLNLPIKSEKLAPHPDEVAKAELYDNIMKEKRAQNLRLQYGSPSVPSHSLASGLQITYLRGVSETFVTQK